MKTNSRWKNFRKVVKRSEESFTYAIVRQVETVDPETRTITNQLSPISTGLCTWSYPMERVNYEIDGRTEMCDVLLFFVPQEKPKKADLILREDRECYYLILGVNDLRSHIEVQAKLIETGLNTFYDEHPELNDLNFSTAEFT